MGAEQLVRPIAKPREHSPQPASISRIGEREDAFKRIPSRRKGIDGGPIDDSFLSASNAEPESSGVVPELSRTAASTFPTIADVATPPMAPGIGGFNIDPPTPRTSPVAGAAALDEIRSLLEPKPIARPPLRAESLRADGKPNIVPIDRSSFLFNILGIIAIVSLMSLALTDQVQKQASDISRAVTPSHEITSAGASTNLGRLTVENQKGVVNEPLPLGVSLKGALDGETVTVAGLAQGTELSLGISKGPAGWLLSARDLDKTFVGARDGFLGVMDAKVNLHSASGQLLDSQLIRFEWTEKR